MKIIKLPKWIFPKDAGELKYWIHILIISMGILGTLQIFTGGEMFTLRNILLSIPLVGFWDIVSETIIYNIK